MHYSYLYHYTAPHLLTTVRSITALQGQSISFDCIPTPNNTMIQWSLNGRRVLNSEQVTLSPQNLHHILSIRDPDVSDSGVYTCYVEGSKQYINRTISVTVVRGMHKHIENIHCEYAWLSLLFLTYVVLVTHVACPQDYIGGLLWERQRANQLARISCSRFHPSLHTGVYVTRTCGSNGEWGSVDFCRCTMRLNSMPFILIEVKGFGPSINVTALTNQVLINLLMLLQSNVVT